MSINIDEPQLSRSADIMRYFTQTKKDFDSINKSLMNNVESIDSENQRLKEAIAELLPDLKEKEASLDHSQKIITRLNEEYTRVIQEYEDIKAYALTLEHEANSNKNVMDNIAKTHQQFEKLSKLNEAYKLEIDKLKREVNSLKAVKSTKQNELTKSEKESTDKDLLIADLKRKGESWISMIKERERLLGLSDGQIRALNKQLIEKDEQLRMMMNFSKDINNENKVNVKEMTKQAVQTIKLLYNAMNNNSKEDKAEPSSRIELIEDESSLRMLIDDVKDNKCAFILEEGLKSPLYVPFNAKSVSQECLLSANLKNELIKVELMASLIRESSFVAFLEGILSRLDIKRFHCFDKSKPLLNSISSEISSKMISLKENYERECKRNEALLNENQGLCDKINELGLYIQKSKRDYQLKLQSIQKKVETLDRYYQNQIKSLKIMSTNGEDSHKLKKGEKHKPETQEYHERDECFLLSQSHNSNYKTQDKPIQFTQSPIVNLYTKQENAVNQLRRSQIESIEFKPLPRLHDNHHMNHYPTDEQENSIAVNDSFSTKLPKVKRVENEALKNEIARLKDEISSLLKELHQTQRQPNPLTSSNPSHQINVDNERLQEGISQLTSLVPPFQFKALISYYLNFSKELDKISANIDDIVSNLSSAESKFARGDQQKRIKMSHLHDIFSEMNKLFSILLNLLSRFSGDLKANTLTLKGVFHFLEQCVYSVASPLSPRFAQVVTPINQCNSIAKSVHSQKSNFFELNIKVFPSSELQKYKALYRHKAVSSTIQAFKDNLNAIKLEIDELTASTHSSFIDTESSQSKSQLTQIYSHYNSNSMHQQPPQQSFKTCKMLNEELTQLKKCKRDSTLMNDTLKHFLVVCERISELSKGTTDDDPMELINDVYSLFEEAFYFKIDYMQDDSIFERRLLSKLLQSLF